MKLLKYLFICLSSICILSFISCDRKYNIYNDGGVVIKVEDGDVLNYTVTARFSMRYTNGTRSTVYIEFPTNKKFYIGDSITLVKAK